MKRKENKEVGRFSGKVDRSRHTKPKCVGKVYLVYDQVVYALPITHDANTLCSYICFKMVDSSRDPKSSNAE